MRIAIAQVNPTIGDLSGNRRLVEDAALKAAEAGADLVALPELVLTGYPPMDLLERPGFVEEQLRELEALLPVSRRIAIALGAALPLPEKRVKPLANAAVLLAGGRQVAARPKTHLPTYDVFDENRYFSPPPSREVVRSGDGLPPLGLTVCEDAWVDVIPYELDPVAELRAAGASLVLNLSASPWHAGKPLERRRMISDLARERGVPIVFANQVGGNDSLIFDGGSFAVSAQGRVLVSLPLFEPALAVVEVGGAEPGVAARPNAAAGAGPAARGAGTVPGAAAQAAPGPEAGAGAAAEPAGGTAPAVVSAGAPAGLAPEEVEELSRVEQLEAGLVLGIRDYFQKQDLPPRAVVGLSGGIDSAVTAHLAARALGPERVLGLLMPGPFSSEHGIEDARALGRNLGIEVRRADIDRVYDGYLELFRELFGPRGGYGVTQENIQARIRGALLMAVSNEEGRLVLATGNKSELSVGYCTLYGDMVGGLAVIGDVYKHDVYALARHANRDGERIPFRVIEKRPSAELAPDQYDTDTLPPYDVLDAVLEQAIEGGKGPDAIVPPPGAGPDMVRDIVDRLDRNEYKRRQAPLVLRTTRKAFGSGRRLPIVHRARPHKL